MVLGIIVQSCEGFEGEGEKGDEMPDGKMEQRFVILSSDTGERVTGDV